MTKDKYFIDVSWKKTSLVDTYTYYKNKHFNCIFPGKIVHYQNLIILVGTGSHCFVVNWTAYTILKVKF